MPTTTESKLPAHEGAILRTRRSTTGCAERSARTTNDDEADAPRRREHGDEASTGTSRRVALLEERLERSESEREETDRESSRRAHESVLRASSGARTTHSNGARCRPGR